MVNSAGFQAGMTAASGTTAKLGVTATSTSGMLAGMAGAMGATATAATTLSGALWGMAIAAGAALAAMLPMVAVLASVYAVIKAGKTAEEFSQAMRSSIAIMGDVSEHQAKMSQVAKQVAFDTKFSNKEAAESYFFLASAGLDAQQSMAALPFTAKFAQAGMFDMALATDLLTDAQSALGLTVKDATQNLKNMARVGDVLVKANTLANASVQQFSEALTHKAAAAGRVAGKSIEEVVSVLAALADQGVKAQNAGTALNIILREMQGKSMDNAAAFEKFGVTVWESSGAMRHMADIIEDMEKAMDGMSAKQKKAMLMQMGFQAKSVIFIQTLLGTSDKIRGYNEELDKAGGITEEVAGKQLPAFTDAMKKLWNIIGRIAILGFGPILEAIGHILLIVLKPLNMMVTGWELLYTVIGKKLGPILVEIGAGLASAWGGLMTLFGGETNEAVIQTNANLSDTAEAIADIDTEVEAATESMEKWVAKMREEIEYFGKSARVIALYRHAKAGAFKDAEALNKAFLVFAERERLDDVEEGLRRQASAMKAMESQGRNVFNATRTSMEKYESALEDLNSLVTVGAIGWDTYRRGVLKAGIELRKALGAKDIVSPAAIVRGTQAAFTAEIKYRAKDKVSDKLDEQIRLMYEDQNKQQQMVISLDKLVAQDEFTIDM